MKSYLEEQLERSRNGLKDALMKKSHFDSMVEGVEQISEGIQKIAIFLKFSGKNISNIDYYENEINRIKADMAEKEIQ